MKPTPLLSSIAVLAVCLQPAFSQWTPQTSPTTASLRGIVAIDPKTAWASGSEGTVLRTSDGGQHWTTCTIPPDGATLDFRGIQAWDASNAIIMASGPGDKSRLYSTKDGCKTWTLLYKNPDSPDGFFDSFFADWSDETGSLQWTGSLLGDPVHGRFVVLDTKDSGATWIARTSLGLALNELTLGGFAASNSLFPARQDETHNSHVFASGGKSGAFVWIESDPQHTWKRIAVPLAHGTDATGIFSIASHRESDPFRNIISYRETMIAVGGDYTRPAEATGTAAWSTDGGLTWRASQTPPHGYRSTVAWSDKLNAWLAAGTTGSDISHDDGKTWQPLDNESWNAISLPFIVGPKGKIAILTSKLAR